MKLLRFALAFILCIGAAFSLSACMKEEDYYTKADVDALIAELNTALAAKEEACNAKISALRDEYEAKVAELEAADAENTEAIAALEAEYAEKVAELEAADALTAEALAALTTKYEKDLADLLAADEANADAIASLTATYESKVSELEAADALTAEALAALTTKYEKDLADLIAADEANADAIASLIATYEAKVEELEAADALTAEALEALTTKYEADLADLLAADEANADAIADLTATYESKVSELEAADALTAEALAALTTKYEKDLADLLAADEANADAIAALTATYESKVSELEAADALTAEALAALTTKYEKDLADLIAADEANEDAIEDLTADYEAKVSELEAKDAENTAALITLTTTYEAKVAELAENDANNAQAIANLKATYEAKIAEIEAEYAEKFASVNALISALQEADLDNVRRIAILEAQMEVLLSKHEHTYGTWISFSGNESVNCENRLYYRICTECNVIEWKSGSYEDHDFNTVTTPPTCVAGGYDTLTCEICGKVEIKNETNILPHDFKTEYSTDNSFHWYDCKNCDATTVKVEHTTDDSGYCTECDEPVGSTVGITYVLSEDETYAIVTGYTGSSKIVIIAAEYNGLPVRTIYDEAFKNSSITSVIIPDSVTSIGYAAFYNCDSLTSVTIPDSVATIGSSAFYDCDSLTSITIPDSVTSIRPNAFNGCSSLTSVTIGNGVTSIGNYAFDGCDNLKYNEYDNAYYLGNVDNPYVVLVKAKNTDITSVTIHENTRLIYYDAFYNCTSLTSAIIGNGVTSIGSSAFYGCTSLTSVNIPANVTSIGAGAFQNCYKLATVTVKEGAKFSFVNSGSNGAFKGCTALKTIDLKNRATNIGDYTFAGAGLTNFTIGDNVATIGVKAFQATKIATLNVPNNVTSIGLGAFSGMTNLSTVTFDEGYKALSFGSKVFINCSSLTSITFPARTTRLDGEVKGGPVTSFIMVSDIADFFAGCISLKNVNVTAGASNKYVSINGVLYRAEAGVPTALLFCPALNEGTLIDGVATIVVPKTVTLVENRSLLNLEKIKTITFEEYDVNDPNYGKQLLSFGRGDAESSIGNTDYSVLGKKVIYKFDNDGTASTTVVKDGFNSVTTLNLPSHLSSFGTYSISTTKETLDLNINPAASNIVIGKYAFSGARIVEYNFPGIKQLAQWAFVGAYSSQSKNNTTGVVTGAFTADELNTLSFSFVFGSKSTLTNIPAMCFKDAKFESLVVPKSVVTIDQAFYNANRLKTLSFEEGSELTTIGNSVFGLCTSLTSVDFTNATKLTSFGTNVFQNCTFTEFVFPENIQAIGAIFFDGCANLETVTLNKNFTPEMLYAFDSSGYTNSIFGSKDNYAVKNLQQILVDPANPYFKSVDGVLYSADMTTIYFFPSGKNPAGYTIPATVTTIAPYAFNSFKGTSLTLPEGLTSIGDNAFEEAKLTSVTIPSKVEYIGNYAFRARSSSGNNATNTLTVVNFASGNTKLTKIGEYAFSGQSNITALNNIPDSVNKIGQYAFIGLQKLEEIVLPAAITEITKGMLQNCYALESVTIPDGVTSIGDSAFRNCESLTSVTIPDSVTSIGSWAFEGCSSLTSVTIGNGVTSIGNYALQNCSSLTSVTIPNSVTSIGDFAFDCCTSLETINYCGTEEEWAAIEKDDAEIPSGCTIVYNYTDATPDEGENEGTGGNTGSGNQGGITLPFLPAG